MVDETNVLWCRPGVRPSSPFTIMLRLQPEAARQLFVRKLHEQKGSVRGCAMALGIHFKRAWALVYTYGMKGKPAEIRKAHQQRFRLPAA